MTDDLPLMVRTVEQFIQDKTGKRIKIVFNDPMKIRMHTKMLTAAFDVAVTYYNNKDK
jgi:hypothetical protein